MRPLRLAAKYFAWTLAVIATLTALLLFYAVTLPSIMVLRMIHSIEDRRQRY